MMKGIEAAAQQRVAALAGELEVFAAAEGRAFQVRGRGPAPIVAPASALPRRAIAGGRVMIVSADELQAASIARVLAEDELVLSRLPNRRIALAQAATTPPDLVIIDQRLPDGDGASLMRSLRARLGRCHLPVILLTDGMDGEVSAADGGSAATDYLATPIRLPMLRTRVRTWLVRTLSQPHGRSVRQARCAKRAQA